MGNISSTPGALPTHTSAHSASTLSEPHRSFSVSPFEYNTFVSITKASSKSPSHGPSPTSTGKHCTWDFEADTSSCSSWTSTVDTLTPFTVPTPTGGYETGETSLPFPYFTCTDFLCIDSVVSKYGYSLCFPTPATLPTETWPWPNEPSTDGWPTITPTCDPVLDWEFCPGPTSEPLESLTDTWPTDEWPTASWDTDLWPTETSSDCDTSVIFTIPEGPPTASATITKHSYSYRSGSTRRASTSSTSDCDFWDDDCSPVASVKGTTWWDPDPWSDHTVSTTISSPRHTAEAKE
ncbi:hypothetical protein F4801DRAFT_532606 [Xylaria longipes]|nr:hypothetical protein F4801DRAFT_532606 [Xylaria longipes]RYC65922.1 hypothetical protein CHU98_g334 [Xylaria longipes]